MSLENRDVLIRAENIYKTYLMGYQAVEALRGVSLDVFKGEFLVLMGASGSGKSTLMHCLGALDNVTNGNIYLSRRNLASLSNDELADIRLKHTGFIFQTFHLIPGLTALENVKLPMGFAGVKRNEQVQRAKEILGWVGLQGKEGHRPSELSGGEQQRVAIARALANNPQLILADEPTGDLDTKTGEMITELLNRLNKEQYRTVVMVTHNPILGKKYGDRLLYLEDGKIIGEEKKGDAKNL